jgi:hypothetical protein
LEEGRTEPPREPYSDSAWDEDSHKPSCSTKLEILEFPSILKALIISIA